MTLDPQQGFEVLFEAYLKGELEGETREAFELELFTLYLDEELEDADRARFEDHLENHEDTRLDFERHRETMAAMRGLDMKFAPDDFLQDVTQTINKQSRGSFFTDSWLFGVRIPFEAFVAVMLAVMGALYLFGTHMRASEPNELVEVEMPADSSLASHEEPPRLDTQGQSMGAELESTTLYLTQEAELAALVTELRGLELHVRPQISSLGDALLVEVPVERAEAFLDAIAEHHHQPAMTPQQLFDEAVQNVITVRLIIASP